MPLPQKLQANDFIHNYRYSFSLSLSLWCNQPLTEQNCGRYEFRLVQHGRRTEVGHIQSCPFVAHNYLTIAANMTGIAYDVRGTPIDLSNIWSYPVIIKDDISGPGWHEILILICNLGPLGHLQWSLYKTTHYNILTHKVHIIVLNNTRQFLFISMNGKRRLLSSAWS